MPKVWRDPHSETRSTYALAGVTGLLASLSVPAQEMSLLVYPGYYCLANAVTAQFIGRRRRALGVDRPVGVRRATSGGTAGRRGPARLRSGP